MIFHYVLQGLLISEIYYLKYFIIFSYNKYQLFNNDGSTF